MRTVAMGHLVVEVWGGPGMENPTRLQRRARFRLSMWPPTNGTIPWPSAAPIIKTGDELEAFHEDVFDRILNPNFQRPRSRDLLHQANGDTEPRAPFDSEAKSE